MLLFLRTREREREMAERQTRSPRTRRGSWNGGKKEEEEGKSPVGTGGEPGPGMSAGRRFMWLLIESFSLDRAACFLRSRDSLRSSLLLLPSPSPLLLPLAILPASPSPFFHPDLYEPWIERHGLRLYGYLAEV